MATLYMVSLVTFRNPSQRPNSLEYFSDEGLKSIDQGTYGGDHDGVEYTTEDVQTITVARPLGFLESNEEREKERVPRLLPTTHHSRSAL